MKCTQELKQAAENAHDKVWGLNCAEAGSLGTKVGISGFFRKSRDILGVYLGFLQNYSWQQCRLGFTFSIRDQYQVLNLWLIKSWNEQSHKQAA